MDWHRAGRDCTYCAHDRRGHQRPDDGGSAHSTGGDNASKAVNHFHVASNWSRVGMGRGKGSPVRAVGIARAGDVLRQHPEAGPGCTQLQKEPYQIA